MQRNFERYLGPVFKRAQLNQMRTEALKSVQFTGKGIQPMEYSTFEADEAPIVIPPEFNGKDYVSFLLCIDAEIEHGLMLQYLYAAYSLGGPQVPEEHQDDVRRIQEVILGIAKEEMGHFISVQNVLKLIGAPLHFERQDYPWDTPFYPFPFKLEPLSMGSLAKYVYAEAPPSWLESDDPVAIEIVNLVKQEVPHPNTVAALFEVLRKLINDPKVIPDDAFQAETYPFQAKFDEWGRGYQGGHRGNTMKGSLPGSPDVLVMPLASRDDAYNAITEIAEQGEAPTHAKGAQPSHFERFLDVYNKLKEINPDNTWSFSRNLAVNPEIPSNSDDPDSSPSEGQNADEEIDIITNIEAQNWGHLFNLRYRMLLNFLTHSFVLDNGFNNAGAISPRGMIINSTFGEMYNLRSIAAVMVQLPLEQDPGTIDANTKYAGPPFLVPYTLSLPAGEHNRWRAHRDLIQASAPLIQTLLSQSPERNHRYLYSLLEADAKLLQVIEELTNICSC
ncbi:ferritin-like domain-containing protein [Chitinophaga filiformis]|uniref:Ferritin-like protein n=1 Tax=Chitinophaga filiformis TaxID=104663 RepID=A0ABY4HSI1_CHIFI|nr:ferritin-like protein [Chitinophaga filiformis]UPK66709.1 ferritin-like protein [Chitinophaga filiformis]